ncbi:MAG: hypothetical protein AAGA91_16510 [Pseudomonadota bacterium]
MTTIRHALLYASLALVLSAQLEADDPPVEAGPVGEPSRGITIQIGENASDSEAG